MQPGEWCFVNEDGLPDSTVYIRLSDDEDPDTKAAGFVQMQTIIPRWSALANGTLRWHDTEGTPHAILVGAADLVYVEDGDNFKVQGYPSGVVQTETGSMNAGFANCILSDAGTWQDGDRIRVTGAGWGGRDHYATVSSGGGTTTLHLSTAAEETVSTVAIYRVDNTLGGYFQAKTYRIWVDDLGYIRTIGSADPGNMYSGKMCAMGDKPAENIADGALAFTGADTTSVANLLTLQSDVNAIKAALREFGILLT